MKAAGFLELEKANVKWFLSIDKRDTNYYYSNKEVGSYRSMKLNNTEIDFSKGFEDLHLQSYQNILNNKGFGIEENIEAIKTVSNIRKLMPIGKSGSYHPIVDNLNITI